MPTPVPPTEMPAEANTEAPPKGLTPWQPGQSGNPSGRPKMRLERYTREQLDGGKDLVDFWKKVFLGQPFKVGRRTFKPTLQDMMKAAQWLADRGWGKAPQVVTLEDEQAIGFTIIHRQWPIGVDPLAELDRERVVDGQPKRTLPPGP